MKTGVTMTKAHSLDISAYEATKAAVAEDASAGAGAFRTVTTWTEGAQARTTARSFTLETDEPAPLGGTDKAIDPMELVLAAIGTCLTIGWVTQAVQRGVQYRDLRIEVTGDFDLRGYLALDQQVRPGFSGVNYVVHVDTDAPADVLEEIRAAAEATSPMFDNVKNATPVQGSIEQV
ncbi:OsmC family protein [Nocardia flavorosea]|uniref:OsmC family protein n=1 Tax=Nocardia flavorosea TaxID=53429 RepID=UPI001895E944|nr:OsmC family protein [Nocardia flavorosea]MBF6351917.1 OsmC family protein [Nocardia flavorosea]